MGIVDTKYSLNLATTQKIQSRFPDMEQSSKFIFNMQKDLRKWCNENYHLLMEGNGIEDEPLIGFRENVNTMHYNHHFNFEERIWEHPKQKSSSVQSYHIC